MTLIHLHLLLNHLPVPGLLIGLVALGLDLRRPRPDLQAFGLGTLGALGLMTCLVFATGDGAATAAGPELAGQPLEAHRDAARVAMIASTGLGTGALAALLLPRRPGHAPRWATLAVGLGTLACAGLLVWAGALGGALRHAL